MLKVLLINEKKNVNLVLEHTVDWEGLGLELVGTLTDGESASNAIRRTCPDILIISAKLRDVSFDSVIRHLNEEGCLASYIVINGPKSYEFSVEALRLGCSEYLEGPADTKRISEALKKVAESRSVGTMHDANTTEKYFITSGRPLLRRHFLNSILEGDMELSRLVSLNPSSLFNFAPGTYQIIIVAPDFSSGNSINKQDLDLMLNNAGNMVTDCLHPFCKEIVWVCRWTYLVCAVNYQDDIYQYLDGLLSSLAVLTGKYNKNVSLILGSRENSLGNLRGSLFNAERALCYKIVLGSGRIIDYEKESFNNVPITDIVTSDLRSKIRSAINNCSAKAFHEAVHEAFLHMKSIDNINPAAYYDFCGEIHKILINEMVARNTKVADMDSLISDNQRNLITAPSIDSLEKNLSAWAAMIIELISLDESTGESKAIRTTKSYINEHFREAVRLETLSDITGLNSSYLSTLFKSETGMNFSEYLIECRVKEAKRLFDTTDDSVTDVMHAVGYSNSKYFGKIFTKGTGMTPSEYLKSKRAG